MPAIKIIPHIQRNRIRLRSKRRLIMLTRKPRSQALLTRRHVRFDLEWQRDTFARNHPEYFEWYDSGLTFYKSVLKGELL